MRSCLLVGVAATAGVMVAFAGTPPLEDTRPCVALVIAEDEYETEKTLPEFASRHLAKDYQVMTILGDPNERHDLPGLEALDRADVLVVSVRRRAPTRPQLDAVRRFIKSGKPVVGIRTASHAFALRAKEAVPSGHDVWPTFDPDVLGGHYTGHHKAGAETVLKLADGAGSHPILKGVSPTKLVGKGSLYKVSPLSTGTVALLIGAVPDAAPEPVAWTYTRPDGGKTFYTSLGHPEDFSQPDFQRLLRNAIDWALADRRPAH